MVYKGGRDFRIGLEIPCNIPFSAAGKQGVRENSSQGNHVTNITLAHNFVVRHDQHLPTNKPVKPSDLFLLFYLYK